MLVYCYTLGYLTDNFNYEFSLKVSLKRMKEGKSCGEQHRVITFLSQL